MADFSSRPVSTMPGSMSAPPDGVTCDNHPDLQAVRRVQGETDSMGCEYHDLCETCAAKARASAKAFRVGNCDWCKSQAEDLRPRRDFEEGLAGRLYDVCGNCVRKENDRLAAESDERDDYYNDDSLNDVGPEDDL